MQRIARPFCKYRHALSLIRRELLDLYLQLESFPVDAFALKLYIRRGAYIVLVARREATLQVLNESINRSFLDGPHEALGGICHSDIRGRQR